MNMRARGESCALTKKSTKLTSKNRFDPIRVFNELMRCRSLAHLTSDQFTPVFGKALRVKREGSWDVFSAKLIN